MTREVRIAARKPSGFFLLRVMATLLFMCVQKRVRTSSIRSSSLYVQALLTEEPVYDEDESTNHSGPYLDGWLSNPENFVQQPESVVSIPLNVTIRNNIKVALECRWYASPTRTQVRSISKDSIIFRTLEVVRREYARFSYKGSLSIQLARYHPGKWPLHEATSPGYLLSLSSSTSVWTSA